MRSGSRVAALAAVVALAAAGCRRDPRPELEQAVRTYLDRVADAYRTSDASLVDPLLGDEQGLKIVGLIGVKRDSNLFLDAKLLELRFEGMREAGKGWEVETRERWYYQDRRIGTGEQVGLDSTDEYALRYTFVRRDGNWILELLEFREPPQVGRAEVPADLSGMHLHGSKEDADPRPQGHPTVEGLPPPPGQGAPAAARPGVREGGAP